MGRARVALSLTIALVAPWARPAAATVFSLRPTGTFGVTDNPFGISQDQVAPSWEAFGTVGLTTQLQLNEARSTHQLAYSINRTAYQDTGAADNTSHALLWASELDLTGKTTLNLGASAGLFSYSAIANLDAATANPTGVPIGTSPTTVVSVTGIETLTYNPSGREKYLESLSALRFDPLSSSTPVPATTSLTATGRADRQAGRNDLSLTLTANDYLIDSATALPSSFANGSVITGQLLGGWRREFGANASLEANGGLLAFYGVDAHSLAVGPAVNVTLSYKHLPWFASLNLSQQPMANIYIGEALLMDAVIARAALPLDKRERLQVVGIGGYTYARRIAGGEHFIFAPRAYDLFVLDAALSYHFENLPFFASVDYTVTTQRGSLSDGIYIPSSLRRVASLSLGGQLAWGEGNSGWRTAESSR